MKKIPFDFCPITDDCFLFTGISQVDMRMCTNYRAIFIALMCFSLMLQNVAVLLTVCKQTLYALFAMWASVANIIVSVYVVAAKFDEILQQQQQVVVERAISPT